MAKRSCRSTGAGRPNSWKAIVIETPAEAAHLDFTKDIRLYSQTTKSLEEFWQIIEYIKEHISPDATFEFYDTICRQVANRMPNIRKFAAAHDLIFLSADEKFKRKDLISRMQKD